MAASTSTAQATFELNNDIKAVDQDKIFRYDAEEQRAIQNARPWRADPGYFKKIKISGVALIKMVIHARSGGQYEIMGLMQGKIDGDTFIVMDSFALPVQGTETRVNAANEANEYMVEFLERSKNIGRLENAVGWYHSHPGYGCWLSGIDVNTQMTNQMFQDPFVAVVIDPNRTISAGRVDIGAFRTYPENYKPPNASSGDGFQSIPLNKIEDFGAHANSYYSLDIEIFKSSLDNSILDLLWNKYWVSTLSGSGLITNRAYTTSQISDLTEKLSRTDSTVCQRCNLSSLSPLLAVAQMKLAASSGNSTTVANSKPDAKGDDATLDAEKEEEKLCTALGKAVRESEKLEGEGKSGLIAQILKEALFNRTEAGDLLLPVA